MHICIYSKAKREFTSHYNSSASGVQCIVWNRGVGTVLSSANLTIVSHRPITLTDTPVYYHLAPFHRIYRPVFIKGSYEACSLCVNLAPVPNWAWDFEPCPPSRFILAPAAMDAPEADIDIKLQKISADLISEFDRFLPKFLRKPDGNGGSRVRSRVRARELNWVTATVSSFHLLFSPRSMPSLLFTNLK